MKTVRFSRVVDAAGRPHVHTLWTAPEDDAELKHAREAHRVMTLASARGRTDAGVVGYDPKKAGEFLIFPKSLARFDGARVVGIKFDLVAQPKSVAAKRAFTPPKKSKARASKIGKTKSAAEVIPFVAPTETNPQEAKGGRLVREVRAALRELEAGKSVAAYRRLEKAIAD